MKPERDHPLTTADLARANEPRGDQREPAATREARSATADARSAPARPVDHSPLFGDRDAGALHKQWSDVQAGFVDEPRRAVQQADALVADVMKRLAETFASERANLEQQWDRGDNVTTEDLRVALQRYRSFFDRLLAV